MTKLSQESLRQALSQQSEYWRQFEATEFVITRNGLVSALTSGNPELRDTALKILLDVFDAYTRRRET